MKKHLKKHKVLYIILGVIIVIVIGAIIAITNPKNLGVGYTKADLDSVNKKLGINYASLPSSNEPLSSIQITGSKPINEQITQSELTALLNQPSKQWKNYPVSNVQLKINDDGSVEMTGKIIAKKFNDYADATNMPDKYKNLIADKADLVPVNPSFDYKGNLEIKNGKVEGEVTELKVGPMTVPQDWTNDNKDFITGFVEDRINSAGMDIQNANFEGGKLNIDGTVPESISFEK